MADHIHALVAATTKTGAERSLDSTAGDNFQLAPNGTAYQAILDDMKLPLSGATAQ